MTGAVAARTNDAADVNPLRVAAAAPAAAVGRTQRFAVVARSATGRTAPR